MEIYLRIVHSMTARTARVVGGFWLSFYGSDLSPGYAFMLAVLGTAIAVTGIADLCPMELVVNVTHAEGSGQQRRAA